MNQARWRKMSGMMRRVLKRWAPPPRLTVSEWADRFRRLSPEASAEPGQWVTARAPFQREMMDVVTEPGMRDITMKLSAQVGKTEIINNIVGYHIDVDPGPIMVLLPTVDLGKAWSKDRLKPMLRDTPQLKGKVKDQKAKDSDNEILHKKFPGGHVTISGANSAASLSSRPIRILLRDEVSRYPVSAGKEGDPSKLAEERLATFWNKKNIGASTPTDEGCRIDVEYLESDQRRYWVPCPHCGEMHLLDFKQVVWEKSESGEHLPETAAHACPHCGALEYDRDLPGMLKSGQWRKGRPEVIGHAGFHLNQLYSPWVKYAEIVVKFLKAKDDPELLKVFVNTVLGECWTPGKSVSEVDQLMERRENYDAELVPMGAVVLTCTVDVQEDRLEVDTLGWGMDRESWLVERRVMYGDPTERETWRILDEYLTKTFPHESGLKVKILGVGIDSGYCTSEVYAFCQPRWGRHVYALKGDGTPKKPLASKPTKPDNTDCRLFRVGVNTAKDLFAHHLGVEQPGPGYCHFPHSVGKDYFEQLLAERQTMKTIKGERVRVWEKKKGNIRNEALDNRVYHYAVLSILGIDLNATVEWFRDRAKVAEMPKPEEKKSGRRYRSRGVAA